MLQSLGRSAVRGFFLFCSCPSYWVAVTNGRVWESLGPGGSPNTLRRRSNSHSTCECTASAPLVHRGSSAGGASTREGLQTLHRSAVKAGVGLAEVSFGQLLLAPGVLLTQPLWRLWRGRGQPGPGRRSWLQTGLCRLSRMWTGSRPETRPRRRMRSPCVRHPSQPDAVRFG